MSRRYDQSPIQHILASLIQRIITQSVLCWEWLYFILSSLPKSFRVIMMSSSNGNIFRVTGHVTGHSLVNSPHKGPWRGALIFFFDLRPNRRLSKQSWGWWFETPLCPLWRHRNGSLQFVKASASEASLIASGHTWHNITMADDTCRIKQIEQSLASILWIILYVFWFASCLH